VKDIKDVIQDKLYKLVRTNDIIYKNNSFEVRTTINNNVAVPVFDRINLKTTSSIKDIIKKEIITQQ
jgi:hypothetical protein